MNQRMMRQQSMSTGSCDVSVFAMLEREDCIRRWTDLFGLEPPRYTSVPFMRQALAYEAQLATFGGRSSAVKRALKGAWRACEATQNSCQATNTGPDPDKDPDKDTNKGPGTASRRQAVVLATAAFALKPGTHLIREWNGRAYQVEVTETGFRLDGKDYRSLSSIARKITGTAWSGPRFFGLKMR